jgi:hypothetical protein
MARLDLAVSLSGMKLSVDGGEFVVAGRAYSIDPQEVIFDIPSERAFVVCHLVANQDGVPFMLVDEIGDGESMLNVNEDTSFELLVSSFVSFVMEAGTASLENVDVMACHIKEVD